MTATDAAGRRLAAARLYALTPDAEPGRIVELAEAWCAAGLEMLQLRHKTLSRAGLLALAERLRSICTRAGTLFIVNDHLDIALLCGADGVHLGEEDLTLADAERALQNAGSRRLLIGASVSSVAVAQAAQAAGADYLGAGPVYATPIKPEKVVLGPQGVAAIQAATSRPVFAIGGVDATRIPELLSSGIDRVCVIRALSGAADPGAEVRRLRGLLPP